MILRKSSNPILNCLLCAVVLAICTLIAHPFVEMGFNDDWCYIWSAQTLAHTGHVTYNGWGAMSLGWQMYLGALFIKLFGFSFVVVRIPVFLIALATAALLQRVVVRCGVSEWNASIVTLTVVLCPFFLPLAFSFMSDVPAFFCVLVCAYACLRAMQSPDDRHALWWLAFAAISNALGGTVRQIAWLGVLAMVPAVAWAMRRRRGAVVLGLGLWICSVIAIFAFLHWFAAQPYTFKEPLIAKHFAPLKAEIHCWLATCFCGLPILLAFLVKFPYRRRTWWKAAMVAAPFVYAGLVYATVRDPRHWVAPFSNDEFTIRGIDVPGTLLGDRPFVWHAAERVPLAALMLIALVAVLYFVQRGTSVRESQAVPEPAPRRISDSEFFWLTVPYAASYMLLVVTREFVFDRYFIPILFVILTALARLYERRVGTRFPALTVVALVAFALFDIAGTHDLYATLRARAYAAEQLRAAGVLRDGMYAGLEYDGWTQLQINQHVNNPLVTNPVGAWRDVQHSAPFPTRCSPWWDIWTPDIHAKYELSYDPLDCRTMSKFGPYEYRTWLAPRDRKIYVLNTP